MVPLNINHCFRDNSLGHLGYWRGLALTFSLRRASDGGGAVRAMVVAGVLGPDDIVYLEGYIQSLSSRRA